MPGRFKNYFLRGLAVLLPTILTIAIFVWGYNFIQENISRHINQGLVWLTMLAKGLDYQDQAPREVWEKFWLKGWHSIAGFLVAREEQKGIFSRVVAVEYPRKGIWSMGFVTGSGLEKVVDNVKKEFLTILIPTSPTPFTGFVIMVPKKQTIELDMTVEEALRFAISAGVITPGGEHVAAALPKAGSENDKKE
jgi:uncharacterized membrane protein